MGSRHRAHAHNLTHDSGGVLRGLVAGMGSPARWPEMDAVRVTGETIRRGISAISL